MNMKEFNLEEAKAGAKVCTHEGAPVRILCYDRKGLGLDPIVGLAMLDESVGEAIISWRADGIYASSPGPFDLMLDTDPVTKWINIYRHEDGSLILGGFLYDSEEAATLGLTKKPLKTIKIKI